MKQTAIKQKINNEFPIQFFNKKINEKNPISFYVPKNDKKNLDRDNALNETSKIIKKNDFSEEKHENINIYKEKSKKLENELNKFIHENSIQKLKISQTKNEIIQIKNYFWKNYQEFNEKTENKSNFLVNSLEKNEIIIMKLIEKIEKVQKFLEKFAGENDKYEKLKLLHKNSEDKEKLLNSEIFNLKLEKKANYISQKVFLKRISGFQNSLERIFQLDFEEKM